MGSGGKAAAVGYGSTLFTMPSGVAGPMPSFSIALFYIQQEDQKRNSLGATIGLRPGRQRFDLVAALQNGYNYFAARITLHLNVAHSDVLILVTIPNPD